jgi:hypothetical protein
MKYSIELQVSDEGFWLANIGDVFGYVEATPGQAVNSLLDRMGVQTATSALVYDAAEALEWAKAHDMALALDKKAFETIAKASPLPFVTVEESVTVTLPTDTTKLWEE